MPSIDEVYEEMKHVYDPEYPIPITDLNIVLKDYIKIDGNKIIVEFKPTTPYCPSGGIIGVLIRKVLKDKWPDHENK